MSSPTASCSLFRSSTAPSESTPASTNGASGSTALPAVPCTSSSTTSSETTFAGAATTSNAPPWIALCGGGATEPASKRAVGWSKISVLGRSISSPTAACSLLRSSTAPSESMPASMSGASTSTALPAVPCTSSTTASNATPDCTCCTAVHWGRCWGRAAAGRRVDIGDRNAGGLSGRNLLHATGTMLSRNGALGSVASCSAARPCDGLMRPKPDAASMAAMRSLAAPRAAIPVSPHAPHCTLVATLPLMVRPPASASRHELAAL
eukprot:241809-Prymnesium_polylepis.1